MRSSLRRPTPARPSRTPWPKNDGKPGYTYDDAVRTVTIAIADDGAGTLTATTTVSGGPEGTHTTVHKSGENKVESALVLFHNSYSVTTNTPGGTAALRLSP
ncbi:MAG: Spy0128 family protein [Collinsella sp.]